MTITPKLAPGYAFMVHQRGRRYQDVPNDDWNIITCNPNDNEIYLGTRFIDGVEHNVWGSPLGGWFWAQVKHNY